jgi:hypothetical protein
MRIPKCTRKDPTIESESPQMSGLIPLSIRAIFMGMNVVLSNIEFGLVEKPIV